MKSGRASKQLKINFVSPIWTDFLMWGSPSRANLTSCSYATTDCLDMPDVATAVAHVYRPRPWPLPKRVWHSYASAGPVMGPLQWTPWFEETILHGANNHCDFFLWCKIPWLGQARSKPGPGHVQPRARPGRDRAGPLRTGPGH